MTPSAEQDALWAALVRQRKTMRQAVGARVQFSVIVAEGAIPSGEELRG